MFFNNEEITIKKYILYFSLMAISLQAQAGIIDKIRTALFGRAYKYKTLKTGEQKLFDYIQKNHKKVLNAENTTHAMKILELAGQISAFGNAADLHKKVTEKKRILKNLKGQYKMLESLEFLSRFGHARGLDPVTARNVASQKAQIHTQITDEKRNLSTTINDELLPMARQIVSLQRSATTSSS